ncbi:MAG: SOS response-associated peptidase [Myxococcales bacterium]|nr:SOS response-associated peptidase [Myxococcales bacterium]
MCGRYTLTCPDEDTLVANLPFDAFSETRIELRPRYNIAPGQRSPVIYFDGGSLILADSLWGFERSTGGLAINARSETAERTAMFRDAFRGGRCLVPADGFLEWRREGRVNQPYLFRTQDRSLFSMAGLWKEGRYVVLTQDSAGEVEDIHDRMPVVLSGERARQWLHEGELSESPPLTRTAVSARINRIENDDPGCIEPLAQGTFQFD